VSALAAALPVVPASWLLAAGTEGEGLDPNSISPGLIGFLATFAVVIAAVLLFINMSRRLRRMKYREERDAAAERAAQEQTDQRAGLDGRPDDGDGNPGAGSSDDPGGDPGEPGRPPAAPPS
jgi:hypothetical protein